MTSVPGYPFPGGQQQEECIQGTDCSWVRWCEDWANSIISDRSHEHDPWVSEVESPWKGTTNIICSLMYICFPAVAKSKMLLLMHTCMWSLSFHLLCAGSGVGNSRRCNCWKQCNCPLWYFESSLILLLPFEICQMWHWWLMLACSCGGSISFSVVRLFCFKIAS